jgi:hypothetical protein
MLNENEDTALLKPANAEETKLETEPLSVFQAECHCSVPHS